MRQSLMNKLIRNIRLSLGLASLTLVGCASVGDLMVVGANLSGQKQLQGAAKSYKRGQEVNEFTPEQKYYTGRTVAATLLTSAKASDDSALEAYVGQVGQTLAGASGLGELPEGWHFMLLDGVDPDAFACPGGLIFVSKGLIKLCQNEDDLAGVLAHEIAHVALDHPIKSISSANTMAALSQLAAFGLEKAVAGKQLGDTTKAFDGVVKSVAKGVSHGYDRDKESEADLAAVHMLIETGYDPRGLKRVLERLTKGDHSHGDPSNRAKAVEAEAFKSEPVPKSLAARSSRFNKNLGL